MMIELQLAHVIVYDSFRVECHVASSRSLLTVAKRHAGCGSALR